MNVLIKRTLAVIVWDYKYSTVTAIRMKEGRAKKSVKGSAKYGDTFSGVVRIPPRVLQRVSVDACAVDEAEGVGLDIASGGGVVVPHPVLVQPALRLVPLPGEAQVHRRPDRRLHASKEQGCNLFCENVLA